MCSNKHTNKKVKYRQCTLDRKLSDKITCVLVSWIPSEFAVLNKTLKLKTNDKWEDGWVVTYVGQETNKPFYSKAAIKSHKKHTGDSLPKKKR